MNGLEQWGLIILVLIVVFTWYHYDDLIRITPTSSKFDKVLASILGSLKLPWKVFTTLLGILFVIGFIVMWLGFFGIIPAGSPPDDGHDGRYTNEMYDPFR
ncbi:MAG: hypothetical protein ACSLEX_03045 [Minisyncoccota bacterium]